MGTISQIIIIGYTIVNNGYAQIVGLNQEEMQLTSTTIIILVSEILPFTQNY